MSPQNQYDFGYLRVLVVDDSRFMLRVVQQILDSFGVGRVEICGSGNGAYEIAQSFGPDIIITDWEMENGDGPELIHRLRHEPASRCQYSCIILLTGFSEKHRVLAARDFGIHEFLTKPVTGEALYKRLISVIERSRPFVRSPSGYFGPDRRRRADPEFKGPDRREGDSVDI